jgi:hypothetical protein
MAQMKKSGPAKKAYTTKKTKSDSTVEKAIKTTAKAVVAPIVSAAKIGRAVGGIVKKGSKYVNETYRNIG